MRPATYESEVETRIMLGYYTGFEGKVVNTVFCLLDPKGERLIRAGRSPGSIFDSPAELVSAMRSFAGSTKKKSTQRSLPLIRDLRLGLNIAACDSLPLVVGLADGGVQRKRLLASLAKLAWSKAFCGQAHYVLLERGGEDHKRLLEMEGFDGKADIQIYMPDAFGQKARLIAMGQVSSLGLAERFAAAFQAEPSVAKNARRHIAEGKGQGLVWKSASGGDV